MFRDPLLLSWGQKMRTQTPSNPPLSIFFQEVPFPVFPVPSDKLSFGRGKGKQGYAVFSVDGEMAMQGQRSETQLNVERNNTNKETNKQKRTGKHKTKSHDKTRQGTPLDIVPL